MYIVELRHLRYFTAVAEELHMTRAAERLGIQQPPLSQQIKALETEIGARLFRRLPRGLALSEAGAAFLPRARAILAAADDAAETARRAAAGSLGNLAIGYTTPAGFHPLVTGAIRRLRAALPEVSVTLDEQPTEALVEAMARGAVDAAFIRAVGGIPDGYRHRLIAEEPIHAVLPEAGTLARGNGPIALSDLAGEDFVLGRPGKAGEPDVVMAACLAAGFTPRIVQRAPRMTSAMGLAAAGLGIALVPQSVALLGIAGVRARPVAVKGRPLVMPLYLAYRDTDQGPLPHLVRMVGEASG